MASCGNCITPNDDGVANLAIGSIRIASFGAGGFLVGDGLSSVDMPAVPSVVVGLTLVGGEHILCHFVHLGIHPRAFAREGIGGAIKESDQAAVDLHADVDGPELLHALELCIGIGSTAFFRAASVGIAHLELPCADGQRSQNALTCLGIAAGAGDGNGCDILIILD